MHFVTRLLHAFNTTQYWCLISFCSMNWILPELSIVFLVPLIHFAHCVWHASHQNSLAVFCEKNPLNRQNAISSNKLKHPDAMRYSVGFRFGAFFVLSQKSTRMHASEYNVIKQHRNKHKLKTSLSKLKTANWKQYPFGSELSLLREFANLFFLLLLLSSLFPIFFALVFVSKVRYSDLLNLK